MIKYVTAAGDASAEQVIEKSRFIAYIRPVGSREEAEAFFTEVRNIHRDASHNVPAFILGEKQEMVWSSDDGEPGGTAGTPILQMLLKEGLSNVAVMVTRYFGGIKLGTGGLARAYSRTAKLALDAAGKREVREYKKMKFRISYSSLADVKKNSENYEILGIEYAEEPEITIMFEPEYEESIKKRLLNISLGKIKIIY